MGKTIFIYELLSACNLKCGHCLRGETTIKNFRVSFNSIKKTLEKLQDFMMYEDIELKLSGGECTIWRDKDKDLSDVILECGKRKIPFAIVTNGKAFENEENIHRLLGNYIRNFDGVLKIYFTVDTFHGNYSRKENCSYALDNIVRYISVNKLEDRFDLYVQSTFTNRQEDNLPIDFMRKYAQKNFKFIVNPLLPLGKGERFSELVPVLDIHKKEKTTLGDYEKYLFLLGKQIGIWKGEEEFKEIENWELFLKFNNCGKTIMIQDNIFYYCMMYAGDEKFIISDIDNFSYNSFLEFRRNNKICKMWSSINDTESKIKSKLTSTEFPFAYGVCSICKEINEKGVCDED